MDDVVKQLKERIDLRDVIRLPGDGGRRSGNYLHGYCPFHETGESGRHKTASFMIYADHYRCLSPKCDAHGDVFNWFAWTMHGQRDGPVSGILFKSIKQHLIDTYLNGTGPSAPPAPERKKHKLTHGDRSDMLHLAYAGYRNLGSKGLTYFLGRGFTLETIRRQLFGYDGSRYIIPIWRGIPRESRLLTLRFRSSDKDDPMRYSGIRDVNDQILYNREALLWATSRKVPAIIVFYGELDAALAWQDGIPAVSPTNGALSFLTEWVDRYPGYKIFVPDKGEEKAAYADAEAFGMYGKVAHFPRGRFKDYGEFRQSGHTARELARCIRMDTGIRLMLRCWN